MVAWLDLARVLTSPSKVFERICERSVWWIPFIVFLASTLIYTAVVLPYTKDIAKQQISEQSKNMNTQQIEQAQAIIDSSAYNILAIIGAIVTTILSILILVGIVHVAASILGGDAKFKEAFAVILYSQAPIVLQQLVYTVLVILSHRMITVGIADILPAEQLISPLGTFLTKIDIFSFWSYGLMATAVAIQYKISKTKAVLVSAGYWVLGTIAAVAVAVIQ